MNLRFASADAGTYRAQCFIGFSPWLKRNLRTFQFIDDDPRAGGECCLADGHGYWQSGDTLRPITMPPRNLSLRGWRHSSRSLKCHPPQTAARKKRPGGLRRPRTVMQADDEAARSRSWKV